MFHNFVNRFLNAPEVAEAHCDRLSKRTLEHFLQLKPFGLELLLWYPFTLRVCEGQITATFYPSPVEQIEIDFLLTHPHKIEWRYLQSGFVDEYGIADVGNNCLIGLLRHLRRVEVLRNNQRRNRKEKKTLLAKQTQKA